MKTEMNYSIMFKLLIIGILSFSCEDKGYAIIDPGMVLPEADLCEGEGYLIKNPIEATTLPIVDTFTFCSNGTSTRGKIYVPAAYETNKNLPVVYLIDFTEQHFTVATDEFEKVIEGVQEIEGFEAMVVTLAEHPDIDAQPDAFQEHYDIFRDMSSYVNGKYTNNTSRTFIGRGSESGIVLMALFHENSETSVFDNFITTDPSGLYASAIIEMLEKEDFSKKKLNKKLHFSFSTSNDRAKCTTLINMITEAQYQWLQFESIEYANKTYPEAYPAAFTEGIKFIFDE